MFRILVSLMIICLSTTSKADTNLSFGYASGSNDGLEITLGYVKKISNAAFVVNYLSGVIFYGKTDSQYREETFSNGQTVCRDHSNGQFANKEKCSGNINIEYTPSVEAVYSLTEKATLGAGYRGGDKPAPYGILMISLGDEITYQSYIGLKAGGSDYLSVSYGLNF